MEIVVNHLTRMQAGFFCVAGLDLQTKLHVRPVIGRQIPTSELARNGGAFDMRNLVALGNTKKIGQKPEVEDHEVSLGSTKHIKTRDDTSFWKLLKTVSKNRLKSLFGNALTLRGRTSAGVDVGKGKASLGVLVLSGAPRIYVATRRDRNDQIRMKFTDGQFDLDVGVTDIRLYCKDHVTPNRKLVKAIQNRLNKTNEILLSVGLTRPFSGSSDYPPCHWLQVNNVHLGDHPGWQLG